MSAEAEVKPEAHDESGDETDAEEDLDALEREAKLRATQAAQAKDIAKAVRYSRHLCDSVSPCKLSGIFTLSFVSLIALLLLVSPRLLDRLASASICNKSSTPCSSNLMPFLQPHRQSPPPRLRAPSASVPLSPLLYSFSTQLAHLEFGACIVRGVVTVSLNAPRAAAGRRGRKRMSEKEEDELLLQDANNLVDDDVRIELQRAWCSRFFLSL